MHMRYKFLLLPMALCVMASCADSDSKGAGAKASATISKSTKDPALRSRTELAFFFESDSAKLVKRGKEQAILLNGSIVAANIVGDKPKDCVGELQVLSGEEGAEVLQLATWQDGRDTPQDIPFQVSITSESLKGELQQADLVVSCDDAAAVVVHTWGGGLKEWPKVPLHSLWQGRNPSAKSALSDR